MGKSTVCALLRQQGFPVFDADHTVHELQKPYGEALPYIAQEFPDSVRNHHLDRQILRAYVTKDKSNLQKLEKILLPLVARERDRFLRRMQARGVRWSVLDIPLLFEKKLDRLCSRIIVVDAPVSVQKVRILARKNMTWETARLLMGQQLPNEKKCQWADRVIKTGLNRAHTFFQVRQVVQLMRENWL